MAIREVDVETIELTLELAKQWDRMRTLNGDRDPDTSRGRIRVGELHTALARGVFHSPTWSCGTVKGDNNKKYRFDGGHSSRMLVQTGSFPEGLHATIRTFDCDTMEDAICLYEQFDRGSSTRSRNDLIKNRAAYIRGLTAIAPMTINRCLGGVRFYLRCHQHGPLTGEETLNLIYPHRKFIAWATPFVETQLLRHSGVIGAMMETWTKDPEDAAVFWDLVSAEKTTAKHPANKLSRALLEMRAERGRRSYTAGVYYNKSISAWNAFRRKQEITSLKSHKGKIAKAI